MDRTEFIGKLQLCYVGDRNAFNEIVGEYDRLINLLNELEKYYGFQNDKLCKDPLKNAKALSIINWSLDKLKELKGNNK